MHRLFPVWREAVGALEESFVAIDVEGGHRRGARHRMTGVRVPVGKLRASRARLHHGVVDVAAHEGRAHGKCAVGEALGAGEDVGDHAPFLGGKARAQAAESGDHLVEDEEDAVLVAELAQALEVALGRRQHAGGARDRLDDHGRDGRSVVDIDDAQQLVGEVRAPRGLAAAVGLLGEIVGRGQVVDVGQEVAVGDAVLGDAAHRHAAEADAVIGALASDEANARGIAAGPMIRERYLERRVDRFGARVAEEHVVEVRRGERGEAVGALEGDRVPELERRGVVEGAQLRGDRVGDALAAVAGVHAPQSGGAVEHFPAVRRRVVHALGGGEEARILLERRIGREGHPVGLVGGAGADGEVVHGGALIWLVRRGGLTIALYFNHVKYNCVTVRALHLHFLAP